MPASSQDPKTFRNPNGYWEHQGSFSVELTDDANKSTVPISAKVEGNVVIVANGRIKQAMGGIQLYSDGTPFFWGYKFLRVIRDGEGNLLWVNYNYCF